jgi:hypothetical protein
VSAAKCVETPASGPCFQDVAVSEIKPARLLNKRSGDGALMSVRIPVTPANRQLLRELRAAELAFWQEEAKAHV